MSVSPASRRAFVIDCSQQTRSRTRSPFVSPRFGRDAGAVNFPQLFAVENRPRPLVRSKARSTKPLDLVAVSPSEALPGREFVIKRGNLVQPIDNLFVGHRRCVATSPFRRLAKSVASVETVVFGSVSCMSI